MLLAIEPYFDTALSVGFEVGGDRQVRTAGAGR